MAAQLQRAPISLGSSRLGSGRVVVYVRAQAVKAQVKAKAVKSKSKAGSYVCLDCGYVYPGNFDAAPDNYRCPVCASPKRRCRIANCLLLNPPIWKGSRLPAHCDVMWLCIFRFKDLSAKGKGGGDAGAE